MGFIETISSLFSDERILKKKNKLTFDKVIPQIWWLPFLKYSVLKSSWMTGNPVHLLTTYIINWYSRTAVLKHNRSTKNKTSLMCR